MQEIFNKANRMFNEKHDKHINRATQIGNRLTTGMNDAHEYDMEYGCDTSSEYDTMRQNYIFPSVGNKQSCDQIVDAFDKALHGFHVGSMFDRDTASCSVVVFGLFHSYHNKRLIKRLGEGMEHREVYHCPKGTYWTTTKYFSDVKHKDWKTKLVHSFELDGDVLQVTSVAKRRWWAWFA